MSSSCSVAVTASSSDPAVWPVSLPILCFGSSWTGILGERRKLESAFGSHEVLRVLSLYLWRAEVETVRGFGYRPFPDPVGFGSCVFLCGCVFNGVLWWGENKVSASGSTLSCNSNSAMYRWVYRLTSLSLSLV